MKDIAMTILGCLGVLALVAAASALGTWVIMLAWNWIAVGLFNLPTCTFWQMWIILFLVGVIANMFKNNNTKESK